MASVHVRSIDNVLDPGKKKRTHDRAEGGWWALTM